MSAGTLVVDQLKAWEPDTKFQKEPTFQKAMVEYLDHALATTNYEVEKEDRLQIDIAVGEQVGIELKHSPNAREVDTLSGQVGRYVSGFDTVIVAVFGNVHSRWEGVLESYPSVHFMHFWKGGNRHRGPVQSSQSGQTHPAFEGWSSSSEQSDQTHPAFDGWL